MKKFNKVLDDCADPASSIGLTGLTYDKFKGCLEKALKNKQRENVGDSGEGDKSGKSHGRGQGHGGFPPTLPKSFSNSSDSQKTWCIFCEMNNHDSLVCKKLMKRKLKSEEVMKICLDNKVCLRCFGNDHKSK